MEATETLERFGVEECGLEPSGEDEVDLGATVGEEGADPLEDDTTNTGELDGTDGAELVGDGDVKVTTVPGDPYDEAFWGRSTPERSASPVSNSTSTSTTPTRTGSRRRSPVPASASTR